MSRGCRTTSILYRELYDQTVANETSEWMTPPGGIEFACDEKHQGRLCEKCADGYYNVGNEVCSKCPASKTVQILYQIGAVVLVVVLWWFVSAIVCSDYEQVDLFFTYLQIAALVQAFDGTVHAVHPHHTTPHHACLISSRAAPRNSHDYFKQSNYNPHVNHRAQSYTSFFFIC